MTLLPGTPRLGTSTDEPDPILNAAIALNTHPAEIRAVSCLAQDTVFASPLPGVLAQTAPMRNPFNGLEEVLYVTTDQQLYHASRGTDVGEQGTPGLGWNVTLVTDGVTGVHPVLHPNGCLYAFCTTEGMGTDPGGHLEIWELAGYNDSSGVPTWGRTTADELDGVQKVFIQYLGDSAATPVVFALVAVPITGELVAISLFGARDNQGQPWERRTTYPLSARSVDRVFAIGYDDVSLAWLRSYAINDDGQLWQGSYYIQGESTYEAVDEGWESGIGGFMGPTGFGAIGLGADHTMRTFSLYRDGTDTGAGATQTLSLPTAYSKYSLWQDRNGLLHLYAVDQGAQLNVLHQISWAGFSPDSSPTFPPVWDVALGSTGDVVAAMRPLAGSVGTYGIDFHPDDTPNQCVAHLSGPPEEALELMSQQLGTSFWESEVVRVALTSGDKMTPTLVPRYKSQITVLDAGGCRVPMCAVTVTADAPVDLEVRGTFYRLRPDRPVTLTTDMAGSLVLKVAADGLVTPDLHLCVSGVAQALTLQPAAEIHKYLAGAGTLPTKSTAFSADTIKDATLPAGNYLFPFVQRDEPSSEDLWLPTSDEVFGWVQAAFAVSAGTPLPDQMTSKAAEGQDILGFTLQTHDRSRPSVEVFTNADQLKDHHDRIGATYLGTGLEEWLGDVVEGVRQAVVTVAEVTVNIADRTYTAVVNLGGGLKKAITGFWRDDISAAYCVELILNAVGGAISAVVDYLTWLLDLADIWYTKGCFEGVLEDLVTEVKTTLTAAKDIGTTWSRSADGAIQQALVAAGEVFGNQYTGRFDRPSIDPSTTTSGFGLHFPSMPDLWPHFTWFQEIIERFVRDSPFDDTGNPIATLIDKLADLKQWEAFQTTFTNLSSDLLKVFDPSNPNTWSQVLVTALVNAAAELAESSVDLAVAAFDIALDFGIEFLDVILKWYSQVVDIPLLASLWTWIQEQAGVDPSNMQALSIGGLAMFMWCVPGTLGYKVLLGEKPFAAGKPKLSDLKPTADPVTHGLGGEVYPRMWPVHAVFQYFCVQQMTADAAFDWKVNNETLMKDLGLNFVPMGATELRIWAVLHWIAYAAGDFPYVWGNKLSVEGVPSDWGPTWMWIMSFLANSADVGVAMKWGYFVNSFEKNSTAPNFYSLLGLGRIVISLLRYFNGHDRGYSFAIWNCAINVTSFVSAVGWHRAMVKEFPMSKWHMVAWVKQRIDSTCDIFAGVCSVEQIVFESLFPPVADPKPVNVTYKKGDAVSLTWKGRLGVLPYDWPCVAPADVPPDAQGGLPPWLAPLDLGDPSNLVLAGNAEVGKWVFDLSLVDDYGPSFTYYVGTNTITVTE